MDVPLRSKPFQLEERKTRTGKPTYRVTGTLTPGGRQKKFVSQDYEAALAQQQVWEEQRIRGASMVRAKSTYLTLQQLREAEAAFEVLRGEGLTLTAVVKLGLKANDEIKAAQETAINTPTYASRTYRELYTSFLASRANGFVSVPQYDNYRLRGRQFGDHIGWDIPIGKITWTHVTAWLESKGFPSKKSWNNYRNDLSAMFAWATEAPRQWIGENPVLGVLRYKKKALGKTKKPRQRLEVAACRELMEYLETHAPKWCTYYAITLFAGIRPDVRNGEMAKLALLIERDGLRQYYSNGYFHLTPEITKEGDFRQVKAPDNLIAWLERYPPTPKNVRPGDYKESEPIRNRFCIPHDGLRHTAISAFISLGHDYSEAADQFGNSEPIIKAHYLRRMSREEAEEFYGIYPNKLR